MIKLFVTFIIEQYLTCLILMGLMSEIPRQTVLIKVTKGILMIGMP